MRIFGLIGHPLSHSFSQKYFTEKFTKNGIIDCQYKNFEIPAIEDFPKIIQENPQLIGLNVTIPYKEQVIHYLDDMDVEARKIGAINTIKINRQPGKPYLKGYNTDAYGFLKSIQPLLKPIHNKALILGTGGASKAVAATFEQLGIEYLYVSRTPKAVNHIGYNDLDEKIMSTYYLIVNSSPLGAYPNIETCPPIPYHILTPKHLLYDLVYNPPETTFMKNGKEQGADTKNGYDMLLAQAERAWEIWNDK